MDISEQIGDEQDDDQSQMSGERSIDNQSDIEESGFSGLEKRKSSYIDRRTDGIEDDLLN